MIEYLDTDPDRAEAELASITKLYGRRLAKGDPDLSRIKDTYDRLLDVVDPAKKFQRKDSG